jgi:type VI secretion system protein ImpA
MSPLSSQTLLEPISADAPCGESLEDTQLLASFDTFRVFGQRHGLDPPPPWADIKSRALEALAKSKDLRVLAFLGSAALRTDGFTAFAETLTVASKWLEMYWNPVFPVVSEDAILRRNALNCFADPMGVVDGLRRLPLVTSRVHGNYGLRDIDIATGQIPAKEGEPHPTEDQINGAFGAMPVDELVALHASSAAAVAALKSIDRQMREAAGSEATPEFDGLSTQLVKIERFLASQLALRPGHEVASSEGGASAAGGASTEGGGQLRGGVIGSRQDAIAALDAVADFFRRTEPSSPIPLFLARAKRLVSKDFLEVLADIAPDAVAQARVAGGLRDGE